MTGAAFWLLDGLMKGFQYRYYVRMREIEYTSYLINQVPLGGLFGKEKISAPRIDMMWHFKGYPVDDKGNPKNCRAQNGGGACSGFHRSRGHVPTRAPRCPKTLTIAPANLGGESRKRFIGPCGTASSGGMSCFHMSSQLFSGCCFSLSPRRSTLPVSTTCACERCHASKYKSDKFQMQVL